MDDRYRPLDWNDRRIARFVSSKMMPEVEGAQERHGREIARQQIRVIDNMDYYLKARTAIRALLRREVNGFRTPRNRRWYSSVQGCIESAQDVCEQVSNMTTPIIPTWQGLVRELTYWRDCGKLVYDPRMGVCIAHKVDNVILEHDSKSVSIGDFVVVIMLYDKWPLVTRVVCKNSLWSVAGYDHPHVSGESLCMGAYQTTIQSALNELRWDEAVLTMDSILRTYNHESPYHNLIGQGCECCGFASDDECDMFTCVDCERTQCLECTSVCESCEECACNNCNHGRICVGCSGFFCNHCTQTCEDCLDPLCESCIGESGLCASCETDRETIEQEAQECETPQASA